MPLHVLFWKTAPIFINMMAGSWKTAEPSRTLGDLSTGESQTVSGKLRDAATRLSTFQSALLLALLSLAISACLSCFVAWPVPRIMDEFSYLLSADTFSHGRLTNPTPDVWQYFQSPHTILQPSYCSKYPPGPGLVLAVGEKLGTPLFGVWMEAAVTAIAVYYLLRARLSQIWALTGGILVIFHPLQLLWSQSFWGGALQAAGGALLVGAALRSYDRPSWKTGFILGIGTSVLALSRPFEGAVFSLLTGGVLALALLRKGVASSLKAAPPLALGSIPPLLVTAVFFALYNKASTGSAFTFPYVIHERTYGGCPVFLWQKAWAFPSYPYDAWRLEASWERASFNVQTTFRGFWRYLFGVKLLTTAYPWTWYWLFLLPVGVTFATGWKRPEVKAAAALLVCFLVSEFQIIWWFPHYFAAAFGLVMLLAVTGLQKLQEASSRLGMAITGIFVTLLIAVSLTFQVAGQRADASGYRWELERATLVDKLKQLPGKHLVIVSYAPDHSVHTEWVYNGADIEGTRVLFAHALADNRPLLQHFRDRTVWWLQVKAESCSLIPLQAEGLAKQP